MSANAAAARKEGVAAPQQGRLQLLYTSHQQLEEELGTLRAYVSAARKHSGTAVDGDGFSPWNGVRESVAKCTEKTGRCLRLFNADRKVTQLKGMPSLSRLYGSSSTAPHERLVAFLNSVAESFEGQLPLDIALSGGRCLQRLDAGAADAYLIEVLQKCLAAPAPAEETANAAASSFDERYRAALSLNRESPAYAAHVRALLLLQIECAAQAGRDTDVLSQLYDPAQLEAVLPAAAREELSRYEQVCWRDAARQRELEATMPATPVPSGSPVVEKGSTASPAAESSSTAVAGPTGATTAAEQRRGAAGVPTSFFGAANWKWHALRIGLLLLLAVLVRFASGPLARALKGMLQVTHTAQTRRRTLTL